MKLEVLLGSSLVLFAAGRTHAAPDAWCGKGVDVRFTITSGDHFRFATEADDSADPDALVSIVGALCTERDDNHVVEYRSQLETARARWSKRLGMTDADWADAVEYAQLETWRRRMSQIDLDLSRRAWSDFTPVEQFVALRKKTGSDSKILDHDYLADALGPKLTEAGRLGYIYDCVEYDETDAVRWALCQGDIDAFDIAKFGAELRADKTHSGAERMTVRMAADKVLHELVPRQREKLGPLQKRESAYVKLFQVAAEARKAWPAIAQANAATLEQLGTFDDLEAKDARAAKYGDCATKTRAAFEALVAAIPAKEFTMLHALADEKSTRGIAGKSMSLAHQAMSVVMHDPQGYLVGAAYAQCAGDTENGSELTRLIGSFMAGVPGYRGPRHAVMSALLAAEIETESRSEQIPYPNLGHSVPSGGKSQETFGSGVIGKIVAKGNVVHLEFKAEMVTVDDCAKSVETNRITMITPSGQLIYRTDCVAWKKVTVNRADRPLDLDAAVASSLKAGMVVLVDRGLPIAAWAKAGSKQPAIVFGIPVK